MWRLSCYHLQNTLLEIRILGNRFITKNIATKIKCLVMLIATFILNLAKANVHNIMSHKF